MARAYVLINARAGSVCAVGYDKCVAAISEHINDELDVTLANGDPAALVKKAIEISNKGADRAILIGGDGTVAAVAGALAGKNMAMAPLPGGTMNAFSRDIGYAPSLLQAIEQLSSTRIRKVDVAFADKFAFLNNIVFGAYAIVANAREHLREVDSFGEKIEAVTQIFESVTQADTEKYEITTENSRRSITTNTVMISNNLYDGVEIPRPTRSALDSGFLGLYIANSKTPINFVAVLFDAICGGLPQSELIDVQQCKKCKVRVAGKLMAVTIDGEAKELKAPINVLIRHKALSIVAPV